MIKLILVAAGGAIGAILRHLTNKLSIRFFGSSDVYTGTVFANIIGCFLAGFALAYFSHTEIASENLRYFLTIGILGSLTTFSTFASEAFQLIQKPGKKLFLYLLYQVVVTLAMLIAGFGITAWILGGYNG